MTEFAPGPDAGAVASLCAFEIAVGTPADVELVANRSVLLSFGGEPRHLFPDCEVHRSGGGGKRLGGRTLCGPMREGTSGRAELQRGTPGKGELGGDPGLVRPLLCLPRYQFVPYPLPKAGAICTARLASGAACSSPAVPGRSPLIVLMLHSPLSEMIKNEKKKKKDSTDQRGEIATGEVKLVSVPRCCDVTTVGVPFICRECALAVRWRCAVTVLSYHGWCRSLSGASLFSPAVGELSS